MHSSVINVYAAYDIEKIIRHGDSAIFDNLRSSRVSDLVFVRVQHFHALNAQDIPQNTVRSESKQNHAKSNILSAKSLQYKFTYSRVWYFDRYVQNSVTLTIIRVSDAESFRLDPETKFSIGFDLGFTQQISADFVKLFARDCLCTAVFAVV